MLNKLVLSEKDYECLTKGIAIGVGVGVLIGAILENVEFFFAVGGVVGIMVSVFLSIIRRKKDREINS